MEDKKVIIKPIKRESWSGHHRFPKCKDTVIAAGGKDGYVTGLTEEMATRLEKALLMKEGNLSKYSEFWREYQVIISDKELQLDLSKPTDYIDYCVLKASNRVAPSLKERDNYPKAEYIIYDVEEEAKVENQKVKAKKTAWVELAKMGITQMQEVLKVMGKPYKIDVPELIENALSEIIEKNPDEFLKIIKDPLFKDRLFVENLVENNIVRKQGTKYYYGDDSLGFDLVSTIDFLKDPKNQDVKISLMQRLEAVNKVKETV
jgi:hypothetical protein